ncbi:iron chaperone [Agromyces sp. Marseille-Q5079]|uniref:iron chaperone n=1 Tax=Agromyces sp. Marseille-Q5079 TaxID=3439059 RepID=UPI003D9CB4FB
MTEKTTKPAPSHQAFSAEEKAAMKAAAAEAKRAARKASAEEKAAEALADCIASIEAMDGDDRVAAEAIHAIVLEHAPQLEPRTWYGMPAYAKDGKAVVFFQPAGKFKARYASLGFNDNATLDEGTMWPTSYAVTKLTPADLAFIADLVTRAAG